MRDDAFFMRIRVAFKITMCTIFYINYAIILIAIIWRINYNKINKCDAHLGLEPNRATLCKE